MLYSILIYGHESQVDAWTPAEEADVLGRHAGLREQLGEQGRLGPVMRLVPRRGTVLQGRAGHETLLIDGPFAESKEQLMGLYTVDCETEDEALACVRQLAFDGARFELRPLNWFDPGVVPARTS
jgi:hypothetical protein